jgi:molybdopterin molybdotransferase
MHATPDRCAEPSRSITLDEALKRIRAAIVPVEEAERLPIAAALGRVLAEDLTAPFDLPPFANSAMDGYALRHDDVAELADVKLAVAGTAFAGHPFAGKVLPGQCVRIFTGAALPAGADSVLIQEDAILDGSRIRLARPIAAHANVRPAGDEIRCGERLLERGKRLNAADLGLLASAGFAEILVSRRLRVVFFSTGDELRPVGATLEYGQIHDSNRHMLQALLAEPAITALDFGTVPDDPAALRQVLLDASNQADAIVTTGGVSVGDADLVTPALAELGQVDFWKVALKPGKPFAFGRIGPAWLFGLPGNPVAVMVTFQQLVRPALLRLMGAQDLPRLRLKATSLSLIKKSPGRMEFQRGTFGPDQTGGLAVRVLACQGSHQLTGLCRANCYIVLHGDNAGVKPGDSVDIEPFADVFV